jgi:Zn-dependent protease with chaperone function
VSQPLLLAAACLAVQLVVSAAGAAVVAASEPRLLRLAAGLAPDRRARALLAILLLPAGLGLLVSLGLVVPAWLLHEPPGRDERAGPALVLLSALGTLLVAGRLGVALLELVRTARLVGRWRAEGRELRGLPLAATRVGCDAPPASLHGLLRPRLLLASRLIEALQPDELEAVIEHERAHVRARENLKRFLLRAAPDPLVLLPAGRRLLAAFEEASEVAADRDACRRVPPLSLARALLKTARLTGGPGGLVAAALHREGALALRVRELVRAHETAEVAAPSHRAMVAWLVAAAALGVAAAAGSGLAFVHALTERLVHLLS